jgi:hypothetical protein
MAGIATTQVKKGDIVGLQEAFATSFNQLARLSVSTNFHYAKSDVSLTFSTLSGSDAAATAAAIAAGNNLLVVYLAHVADTIAHIAAGTAPALVLATDLTSLATLCEDIRTDYTAHIADTALHPNADATNTIAAATVTNLATAQTFLNEMLNTTALQAHIASAIAVSSLRIVSP